jgi:hypothetical protein
LHKNKKKELVKWNIFIITLYAEKFTIILTGLLVGLKKSNFLYKKTLYPGTSYPGNNVKKSNPITRLDRP